MTGGDRVRAQGGLEPAFPRAPAGRRGAAAPRPAPPGPAPAARPLPAHAGSSAHMAVRGAPGGDGALRDPLAAVGVPRRAPSLGGVLAKGGRYRPGVGRLGPAVPPGCAAGVPVLSPLSRRARRLPRTWSGS